MIKRNQNGITLIALLVTIIVLIIIAGVSIATLTSDNGVLRRTDTAKVTQIEANAGEIVKLATATMRLAIAEASAKDNSYKAIDNTAAIQSKLLEVIIADTEGTVLDNEDTAWYVEANASNGDATFTIKYGGSDYKQACNHTSAEIIYEFELGQKSIEIIKITVYGLKDSAGNDVDIDIGGDTQTPSTPDEPTVPETTKYSVTTNLTNAAIDNTETEIEEGSSYSATITAEEGYEISSVTVTMGGTDVTETAYTSSTGTISISSVTGNIVITVSVTAQSTGYDAVGKVAIGDYVYFNVTYKDVYSTDESDPGYNAYTGWRVIDDGQTHASDETEGTGEIKLISTGTPLKYYFFNTVVLGLNGLTTGFFSTETATTGNNVWRINNFTEQNLERAFSTMSDIIAKYAGGETYTDDYTEAFTTSVKATANQLKVRAANLSDLNRARGDTLKSKTSFASNGALYYNQKGTAWLASAYDVSYEFLDYLTNKGGLSADEGYNLSAIYGVRPVVSLKSGVQVTTETAVTDSNGTYWVMQ